MKNPNGARKRIRSFWRSGDQFIKLVNLLGIVVSGLQQSDFLNFANYLDFLETIVTG